MSSTVIDLADDLRPVGSAAARSDRYLPAESIGREQGLPSAQVHCLSQGADGRIWIAGPAGLSVYDGARIRSYSRADGLSCNGLRTVAGSASGEVWVGSDRGLDLMASNGQWVPLDEGGEWRYGMVEAVAPLSAGSAWLGTSSGMVLIERRADGLMSALTWNVGWVKSVCTTPDSAELWCLVPARGLLRFDGREFSHVPVQLPAELGSLYAMERLDNGQLAICAQFGCALVDPDGGEIELVDEVAQRAVHCALLLRGNLWLGTNCGIVLLRRERESDGWQLRGVGLHGEHVTHFLRDRDGNIWAGTDSSGVHKIGALNRAIWLADQRVVDSVLSIREGDDGELLLGTCRGAMRLTERRGSRRALPITRDSDLQVWDAIGDGAGGYWLATRGGLFHQPPGKVLRKQGWSHPVLDNPARCLLRRPDGELWCATVAGLVRLRKDGDVQEVAPPDGSLGYVYQLVADGEQVWICTLGRGLWRWSESGLEQHLSPLIGAKDNVYALMPGPNGQHAVIANSRLVLRDAQGQERLLAESEAALYAWAVVWRDPDCLLIGSANGLLEMRVADGEVLRRLQPFKVMAGWEFTSPRALHVTGGKAYCGLGAGLAVVDLDMLGRLGSEPKLAVVDVRSDPQVHRWNEESVEMPTGDWRLQVDFAPHWYADEHALRYRYRLLGFSDRWVVVDGLPRAEFTCLPAGDYTLEVEYSSPLNPKPQVVQLLSLRVASFWQRVRDQGLLRALGRPL